MGLGLDAGAKYDVKDWRLSAVVRDVTGTFNAWSYTLDQHTIDVFAQTGNGCGEQRGSDTSALDARRSAPVQVRASKFGLVAAVDLENTFGNGGT